MSSAARREQMATWRRMRNEADEERIGKKSLKKKGKLINSGETTKQYQKVRDETEDEVQMFDYDQDRSEQPRKNIWKDERQSKDKP